MNKMKITILFLALVTVASYAQTKPNILWIMAEDMSPDIKSYGSIEVNTPVLSKLASEGVLYRNAF